MVIYCIENRVRQNFRETHPLSHEVEEGCLFFLNSFSEGSLGTAGSRLSPSFGQWCTINMYTMNHLYLLDEISKFSI